MIYGTVSAGSLGILAVLIEKFGPLLIAINNNKNLTDEQKRNAQQAAFAAFVKDATNIIIADKTGADADAIATGNAIDIGMSALSNKLIQALVPEDKNSYNYNSKAMTAGDYMSNVNKFQSQYEEESLNLASFNPYIPASTTNSSRYSKSSRKSTMSKPSSPSSYAKATADTSSYTPSSLYLTYPSYEELLAMGS